MYIIDIDETICTESYLKDGSKDYKKAKPIKERVAKINKLFNEGNEIHYWTARGTVTGIDNIWTDEKPNERMGLLLYFIKGW